MARLFVCRWRPQPLAGSHRREHTWRNLLVVTSHAKCRSCGGQRHKIARLNLCEQCWLEVKPSLRAEWRRIKDRRKLKLAVDAALEEQRREKTQQLLWAAAVNGLDVSHEMAEKVAAK